MYTKYKRNIRKNNHVVAPVVRCLGVLILLLFISCVNNIFHSTQKEKAPTTVRLPERYNVTLFRCDEHSGTLLFVVDSLPFPATMSTVIADHLNKLADRCI